MRVSFHVAFLVRTPVKFPPVMCVNAAVKCPFNIVPESLLLKVDQCKVYDCLDLIFM